MKDLMKVSNNLKSILSDKGIKTMNPYVYDKILVGVVNNNHGPLLNYLKNNNIKANDIASKLKKVL